MNAALVATDVDGTLVRSDGSLSERTRAALRAVEDLGVLVVFVTGRPPRWMAPLADATGHRGLAICANGALVYDLERERVTVEHTLPADVARDVALALRAVAPQLSFAVERGTSFGHEPGFLPRFPAPPEPLIGDIEELVAAPVAKLLARHPDADPDELLALARSVIGELATVTRSGHDALVEISGPGISKAFALEHIAAEHGIDARRVVAFGDMPNDVPMLAWAGWSVAVANAHEEVLAIADEITASNDEDGVALVLERLAEGLTPA